MEENSESRNKPIYSQLGFDKNTKYSLPLSEKIVSLTEGAGTIRFPHAKNEMGPYFTSYTKITQTGSII